MHANTCAQAHAQTFLKRLKLSETYRKLLDLGFQAVFWTPAFEGAGACTWTRILTHELSMTKAKFELKLILHD